MKEYLALCLQGESTIMKRKEILSRKQEMLRESIRELENSIDYISGSRIFTMRCFPGNARMSAT